MFELRKESELAIDWKTVPVHPVVEMFPQMSPDEYGALLRDVREHGVRVPLVVHEGSVVDGRTRLQAIRDLASQGIDVAAISVSPLFINWDGSGSLVNWAHSLNYHRRHLTYTQKVLIGVAYAARLQKERPQGYRSDIHGDCDAVLRIISDVGGYGSVPSRGDSDAIAGKLAGVAGSAIRQLKRITRDRPDLVSLMQSGKITVWDAVKIASGRNTIHKEGPKTCSRPYNLSKSSRKLIKLMAGLDGVSEEEFLNRLVLLAAKMRGVPSERVAA